ncbi:MAG: phage portal protein [Actinobacteria bacterium]|nr:phage portal protein [Actinomycetota bacterium]
MGLRAYLKSKFPKTTEEVVSRLPLKVQAVARGPWRGGQLTGGEKWTGGISHNGGITVIDTAKTLQNARSATHQSTQARAIMSRSTAIVVDAGLKAQSMPAWRVLGITDDDFKEDWASEVDESFDMYLSGKQCHRSMTETGYQLHQLWKDCDTRDNDQFARLFYSNDKDLVSRVQLELVDPTQVGQGGFIGAASINQSFTHVSGIYWVDTAGNMHSFRDGIFRNAKNQEVAYRVRTRKKTKNGFKFETIDIPAKGTRSKRVFMFHGFKPEYPGQGRGFSKLHPFLQDFQSIVDYVSAIIKKAINQGGMVGFVEPSENAPSSNPMEDQQGGPIVDDYIEGDTIISAGEYCFERSEYKSRVPGADFFANLMPGEKMKFLADTAPGPEFDKFITSIFKYCSAALGYPFEVILMAFNANYSASRAALLEAWRTGRIAQADIKADLMDIWREMWMSEEIAAGRISAPGWFDPRLRQAWSRYILQGPSLPSIDPAKDMGGVEKELKLSLTTQGKAARDRNGTDIKQNIAVNKKVFAESPTAFWEDKPDDGTEPEQQNSNQD